MLGVALGAKHVLADISFHQVSFNVFNVNFCLQGKGQVVMVLEPLFLCPLTHFPKDPPFNPKPPVS